MHSISARGESLPKVTRHGVWHLSNIPIDHVPADSLASVLASLLACLFDRLSAFCSQNMSQRERDILLYLFF